MVKEGDTKEVIYKGERITLVARKEWRRNDVNNRNRWKFVWRRL